MSRWKFTKEEIQEIEGLDLKAFMIGYETKLTELLALLSRTIERSEYDRLALHNLYILRQLSVNCEKFGLIYRRKSIEFMKKHEENRNKTTEESCNGKE